MTAAEDDLGARLIERARLIAEPLAGRAGVMGAFLYGSAARPYADASSDIDLQIVLEDDAPPHVAEGLGSRSVGVTDVRAETAAELVSLCGLRTDEHRRRLSKAIVLHDGTGRVADLLRAAVAMAPAQRETRMRVHRVEMLALAEAFTRFDGSRGGLRLLAAELVFAASNLLFFAHHEWPCPPAWIFDELVPAGVPAAIVGSLRGLLLASSPDGQMAREVCAAVEGVLEGPSPRELLVDWAESDEGMRARAEWGGTTSRLGHD